MARTKIGNIFLDDSLLKYKHLIPSLEENYLKGLVSNTERVASILIGYDTFLKGNTVSIYTTRCELFRTKTLINDDFSNIEEVINDLILAWKALPTEEYWKEQAKGKFNGKLIAFNRIYGTYRFSDEEVYKLLNGETISFVNNNGIAHSGYLAEQEYHNFRYYGFKKIPICPTEIGGIVLSQLEYATLKNGGSIYLENAWSEKKQRYYNATVSWTEENGLKFHF